MSMKKILMAAAAVTALTAGSANAASIVKATLNNGSTGVVYDATDATKVAYKLANETIFPAAGIDTASTGNTIVAKVVSGRLGLGSYTVTYDLTGPAGFKSPLSSGALGSDAGGSCTMTPTLQSGGLAGGKTVTFTVAVTGTCDTSTSPASNAAPLNFTLTSPLTVTGLGDVNVTATFGQGGSTIDNGASTPRTLITNAAAFTTSVTADTVPTVYALAGSTVYTAIKQGASTSNDDVIGKFTVDTNTGVFLDAAGTTNASSIAITADLALTGDFTYLTAGLNGSTASATGVTTPASNFVRATPYTSVTASGVAKGSAQVISLATTGTPTGSQSSKSFSLTVTPKFTTTAFTVPAAITASLQTLGLEGTNYVAPWVGGSQSTANTSIRLSNSGSVTGAVTLQLLAPVYDTGTTAGATTCTSSTLSKLANISANAELVISNADLTACFGNFKRGDVVVTVQGSSASLTAKARNVNAGSGVVSEITLK